MSGGRKYRNLAVRILENIRVVEARAHLAPLLGPCWLWRLSRCPSGYGRLTIRIGGKPFGFRVHGVAFELFTGQAVLSDMTLDHLCFRKHCCNPQHLQQVSRSENSWRRHRRSELTWKLLRSALEALRKATEQVRRDAA